VVPTYSNPDANSPTVIEANDYTLSPSSISTVGSNTITVTYGNEDATFNVTATFRGVSFGQGEIESGYSVSNVYTPDNNPSDYPYTTLNSRRACYYLFDKEIEGGHRYRVEATSNYENQGVSISFAFYTQSALNKYANRQDFIPLPSGVLYNIDQYTYGYQTVDSSNPIYVTIPEKTTADPLSVIKVVRVLVKLNANTDLPNDFEITVNMIEDDEQ
jgi:hypothetical protein